MSTRSSHSIALYLSLVSEYPQLSFRIKAQKCSDIAAALNLASAESKKPSISSDFGRADTPVTSDEDS